LSISDIGVSIGDDIVKIEPFILEEFKMKREQEGDQDNVIWTLRKIRAHLSAKDSKGTISQLSFCDPIDATCRVLKKKKS